MSELLHVLFLALAAVCAVGALTATDLLGAVVALGAFSFFSAMYFASLGALDVAFTEAAVGAAITSVLLVTALFRTERYIPGSSSGAGHGTRVLTMLGLGLVGGALLPAMLALPPVGSADSPAARHVSPRYLERGVEETGASNIVTAVLADYRGYDTLGETTVIVTAGLACLLVLGGGLGGRRE